MTITNLYARRIYYSGTGNLPIVCLLHGYGGDGVNDFAIEDLRRIAGYGFFVVVPGMRGWNSASGSKDASARECWDIYDCIEWVKTNYASIVNPNNIAIVGYSGGGADALAFACRFPDYASVIVDNFGISDYGVDPAVGWYQTGDAGARTICTGEIGGTPEVVPNSYRARYAPEGIINFKGGFLYIFHHPSDTIVIPAQSQLITAALDAAGMTNYAASYSTQWTHGYPIAAGTLKNSEATWKVPILAGTYPAWTIPASDTVVVLGYIVSKRFTIWLRANGSTVYGLDASATVVYNTATDTYTVTPITTGGIDVTIAQGAKSGSAANITEATEIVVT